MLLACCFRGPSKKKHKKNKLWKNETVKDSECLNVLSKILISSPIICPTIIKPVINPDLPNSGHSILSQEMLPLTEIEQKKELNLQRQNKQPDADSLQSGISSTPFSKAPQKLISSSELINISNIPSKSYKLISQDVGLMFASAEDLDVSNLSVSNTHHSYQSHNPSFPPTPERPTLDALITSTPHTKQTFGFDRKLVPSQTKRNSVIEQENINAANKIFKERSPITVQIRNEKEDFDNTSFLRKIREEAEMELEDLKTQHQAELERVKQNFDVELQEVKETHRKNLENAKTNAKNEANETISNLNRQIILERRKMFFEQQNNSRHLVEELKMKEDRFDKSMKEIEEREQTWQDERAEVLKEVQTLKAEATKMVKVLAMEYEEDHLSEDKKKSLSQEVYSLQLVVEMRTGEARNLKDQLARATQQLDQAEIRREKLKKATARMEDLEEQVKMKNNLEKQLSLEKTQLERHMCNTSHEVDRMSKNMEALQWRIRNNFDLPVDSFTPVIFDQEYQRTSLPTLYSDQQKSCTDCMTKHLICGGLANDNQRKSQFFVGNEIIETTTKVKDERSDNFTASYVIDKFEIDIGNGDDSIDSYVIENEVENDSIEDIESLDEGVGDISSDGEQPDFSNFESDTFDKNDDLTASELPNNMNTFSTKTSSPARERLPSRFSFDK